MKALLVGILAAALASPAMAQKKYDPGANDKEIKVGNTNPLGANQVPLLSDKYPHPKWRMEQQK